MQQPTSTEDEITRKLEALREGLSLISEWSAKPSILTRLKRDIDGLVSSCKDLWDSVNEHEDFDEFHELSAFSRSGRFYEIRRTEWGDDGPARRDDYRRESNGSVSTPEDSPFAGSTLAASVSSSASGLLPTVLIGTQSAFATLVPVGTQVALPTYTLVDGKIVLDHYSMFTASTPVSGWYPQPITTLPISTIPVFVASFAATHALDSIHLYLNRRCSGRDAVMNIIRGSTAGAAVGSLYYGLVSLVGISHAPIISMTVSLAWLFASKSSGSDMALGAVANVAGLTAFLVSGNAWLAVLGAVGTNIAGSTLLAWLSQQWSERLNQRLATTAAEILGIEPNASKHEIESAYRKLAREFHPDKSGGHRERFELVAVSKEILIHLLETRKKHKTNSTSFTDFLATVRSIADSFLGVNAEPTVNRPQIELPSDFLDSPD